jgi:glycerol-3-phosphate dehydrogenase
MNKPRAIIIGAGFTGVATAHDLSLRGFEVIVFELGPIANGTSGRTHGLLHSGCRYVVEDQESANECTQENWILRKIVPQVIEPNGGLFVALTENDLIYEKSFIVGCENCKIPIDRLTPAHALQLEHNLNPKILAAYEVPDGTFDPLRLALAFAATAKSTGAKFELFSEVKDILVDGKGNVKGVAVWDRKRDLQNDVHGDIVINCTGAWAEKIARLANAEVPVIPTPGIMVAFDKRLTQRVINRLCLPSDGDIVLPQRRMMIAGTTTFEVEDCDYVPVYRDQQQVVYKRAIELIPAIQTARIRGAYMATRPLIRAAGAGRSLARTFKCYDHKEIHGIDGLVTITGGKATTMRAMAEKIGDLVCQKLSLSFECLTKDFPLLSYRQFYAI